MRLGRWTLAVASSWLFAAAAAAGTYEAVPFDYRRAAKGLEAGDTLILKPDDYKHGLVLEGLEGAPGAWIVIKGADGPERARLLARDGFNTIEIRGCSYVAIENLVLDGADKESIFAISASGAPSHHIRIENCEIVGHGASQQTVGISTKATTWDWTIRGNRLVRTGTGIYVGDADGRHPFIGGVIEYNLFEDSRGYNVQIKHQDPRDPTLAGIPTTPRRTIIRHNVFLKAELPSEDGDRPNLLIGALPAEGLGSEDGYEVYGNVFLHNHRESLLQAEGRVSIHDNVFVDFKGDAVHLQNHYGKVRRAHVYNNTFYGAGTAINFVHPALDDHLVAGNLMLSKTGIAGEFTKESGNLHAPMERAAEFVRSPSLELGRMDFYPLAGTCKGDPLDLSPFAEDTESSCDFNGTAKDGSHRGAYAGEGKNPGWRIEARIKGK